MRMQRNYDEYTEQEGFNILPDGIYMFEIAEKQDTMSKGGDVMIKITLRCIEEEHNGALVWDQILLPLPDSPAHRVIGRSKRFLHAIGEPFQGNFDVDTDNWEGKIVEAKISKGEYNGKSKNIVDRYNIREDINSSQNSNVTNSDASQDDLPF